jgi:hypothetical protein
MNQQKSAEQQEYGSDLLQITLQQLLEQISKRDQKILWIMAQKRAEIAEKDALLLKTQNLLIARESQLHEILNSRTWKLALFMQRIRIFLVPPESRRARMLQRTLDIIFFLFRK